MWMQNRVGHLGHHLDLHSYSKLPESFQPGNCCWGSKV